MSDNYAKDLLVSAGTEVVDDVASGIKDEVTGMAGQWDLVKKVGSNLKSDIKNGIDNLKKSPQEREAEKQKEAAEAKAKEEEEKAKQEAEEQRLKDLQKTYILHTAVILCDKAQHESFVVLPTSHGEFIQGIPQLNVADSKPNINIRSFGICRSTSNPSVQEKAKEILKDVDKNTKKGFIDKVLGLFTKAGSDVSTKTSDTDSPESLAQMCAAECTPKIFTEWIDGKEDVLVDGKPALLGRCTLTCAQGDGAITIFTSGQAE